MRGCRGGWLEFTSSYPNRKKNYDTIKVDKVKGAFRSLDAWENISNLLLYHDTTNKIVKVGLKQHSLLRTEYKISFSTEKRSKKDDDHDAKGAVKVSVGERAAFSIILLLRDCGGPLL